MSIFTDSSGTCDFYIQLIIVLTNIVETTIDEDKCTGEITNDDLLNQLLSYKN